MNPASEVTMQATPISALRQSDRVMSRANLELVPQESESVLLTLLFTDIVGSTEMAERLGDAEWSALLSRHHAIVRRQLEAFRGKEVDTAGDGFFATFDRPGQAVRFAAAARAALSAIGIAIRAGVHAGECDVTAGRVVGVAVHVAARVTQAAQSGEILVSNTVRELLAGSGLRFSSRERQALRGLSEARELFAFEPPEPVDRGEAR
jgi:class 3 adenylate cyclase